MAEVVVTVGLACVSYQYSSYMSVWDSWVGHLIVVDECAGTMKASGNPVMPLNPLWYLPGLRQSADNYLSMNRSLAIATRRSASPCGPLA